MLVDVLKVSISKTNIVHFAKTTFKAIKNALFVNDLRFWFTGFDDFTYFLARENKNKL